MKIRKEDALNYHSMGNPGKIEVIPTKPVTTQRDLALAYSPGVAEPCLEIAADKEAAYLYTSKGNLVGVISNGTAVLGLGNIGPDASKPVMEGKGVLFKKFAGIDVFDIEIDANDPDEFIRIVKSLEPTFGAINLEDIKAPESFYIEERLKQEMNIPLMHDDQHGTAIISGAALLNALELVNKNIEEIKLVVLGAGAAAIACTRFWLKLGVNVDNIIMIDKDGVLRKEDTSLDEIRAQFATSKDVHTLEEAMVGADVFLGLSAANLVKPEHLVSMAKDPVVFALANPNPEIDYDLALSTRGDLVMATGRSDHPNQVNNVLGFPYIFRGALDVRATAINEAMKMAACRALAALAKDTVPDVVHKAYENKNIGFGKEYLIPKPLDPRLITKIAPAVALAAMESGVAKISIHDWEAYEQQLLTRVGIDQKLITRMTSSAKSSPRRIIFAEADNYKIMRAAQIVKDEGIGFPILLGNIEKIKNLIKIHNLELDDCPIIDPRQEDEMGKEYGKILYEKRKRKGMTLYDAAKAMRDRNYFGAAMLELGLGDVLISGLTKEYNQTIVPALRLTGLRPGANKVAGMYIINTKRGQFFFADTTVNVNPTAEELVDIVGLTAETVRFFGKEPRIALLSYSNFGSSPCEEPVKMMRAAKMAKQRFPRLIIDGDIQANIALNQELLKENYPFSDLADKGANTFIFPNLSAGNIAYKLLQEMGSAEVIGPILMGLNKPVHILQLGSSVREIVNMVVIGVVDAQMREQQNQHC
jgi:malate dehydrogenase (oxaloacetate-decarboxylating)(NADP+)